MIKRVKVFDCDGVLVSSLHRYATQVGEDGVERINLQYWRDNSTPEKIMQDELLPIAETYKQALSCPETFVIIATARQCQSADFDYINQILGKPDALIYRREGDTRSGGLLKVLGLKRFSNLCTFPDFTHWEFYEDNLSYLSTVCRAFHGMKGHYIPSQQGH